MEDMRYMWIGEKGKLKFVRDRSKWNGSDKFHLTYGVLYRIEKKNSIYTVIMILHIPICLDIRKTNFVIWSIR